MFYAVFIYFYFHAAEHHFFTISMHKGRRIFDLATPFFMHTVTSYYSSIILPVYFIMKSQYNPYIRHCLFQPVGNDLSNQIHHIGLHMWKVSEMVACYCLGNRTDDAIGRRGLCFPESSSVIGCCSARCAVHGWRV